MNVFVFWPSCLLAMLSVLSVNRAIADKFLFFVMFLGLSLGFLGSWAGIYRRYFEIWYVKLAWNILTIIVVVAILPLTLDAEFIRRCLIVLAILNIMQSFLTFGKRELSFSQIISTMLIILSPPLLLEGAVIFILLIIFSFILWVVILNFSYYERLAGLCQKVISVEISIQHVYKKIISMGIACIFITATALPLFFGLARLQPPLLIIPPRLQSGEQIDYFGKSDVSVDEADASEKYSPKQINIQGWLIMFGRTDKIFLHGLEAGKGRFAKLESPKEEIKPEESPKQEEVKPEEPPKTQQEKTEEILYKAADYLWAGGRLLIFILIVAVLADFLLSIIIRQRNKARIKLLARQNPALFIITAYSDICRALNRYVHPRLSYMAADEYLFIIKNKAVEISAWFEVFTNRFQEALYSSHQINVPETIELYDIYESMQHYLFKMRFTPSYVSNEARYVYLKLKARLFQNKA